MKVQEAHLQKEQKKKKNLHYVSKGRLQGITPNMMIGCVNKRAPPTVISSEHPNPCPFFSKG